MNNIRQPKTLSALLLLAATAVLGGCLVEGETDKAATGGNEGPSANTAPTISGSPPQSVTIGQMYSFTPSASDPDGDTLTFSIQNEPRWGTFDTSTGTLSGTPNLGDEGSYANIRITVSDGSAQSSMPQFAVDVMQSASGSATLSWNPPSQNADGSTLNDLSGYAIYYGVTQGNYPNRIQINNPGVSTYVVENLSPNTYYFVSTALNSNGLESDYSNVAVKVVN